MKKLITILLTLVMLLAVMPLSAFAEEADGIEWVYDAVTRTLTISGEGEMPDYQRLEYNEEPEYIPKEWRKAVRINIEEGVKNIGAYAFQWFSSVKEINMPESLERIGYGAFYQTISLNYLLFPRGLKVLDDAFYISEPPAVMVFTGDAPALGIWSGFIDTLTVKQGDLTTIYYPAENPTWTDEVREAFGPRITWNGNDLPKPSAADVFSDINANAWYYESVQYVYDHVIMTGTAAGTFSPSMNLTRAHAVQMLFNLSGEEKDRYMGETAFDDVSSSAWCAPAVNWATINGIVYGVDDDTFAPNRAITRQELARLLYGFSAFIGCRNNNSFAEIPGFDDADKVGEWAREAMGWCIEAGIISGMSEHILAPTENTTRAQAARMFMQFNEYALENMPVTTGSFQVLADYIIEKGGPDSYWPDCYSYAIAKDGKWYVAEYYTYDQITLHYFTTPSDDLVTGAYNFDESLTVYIHGLDSEYNYYYANVAGDRIITSEGTYNAEGFDEAEFKYQVFVGDELVEDEENAHIGKEIREAAMCEIDWFIKHLMTECGLEYEALFIEK